MRSPHERRRQQLRATARARRRQQRQAPYLKGVPVAASALGLGAGSSWSSRTYANYAREAYQRNVIAYRSINLVAGALGSIQWYATQGEDDEIIESPQHPLVRLLRRPNPRQGCSKFFERMAAFYLIAGNSYVRRIVAESERPRTKKARALELEVTRPDLTRPTYDKDGALVAYVYQPSEYQQYRYPVDPQTGACDVLHLKMLHPTDDTLGLSPVEPSALGVDQHNAASEWNYTMLKNGARPLGVLMHHPPEGGMELTDDQRRDIRKDLDERHVGMTSAGRYMLLEGYLEWKQMGLSPVDMDFGNMKLAAARDICTTYGVPPMLVGITGDATYANYKEARLALWEDTVLPLAHFIRDELNYWLVPAFGENVQLALDEDRIPAIAEKRMSLYQQIESASFVSINEKRELTGWDDWEGGDVIMVSAVQIPLTPEEEAPAEIEPPEESEPTEEEIEAMEPVEAGKVAYGRRR